MPPYGGFFMKIKLYLPQNIFSIIFLSKIEDKTGVEPEFVSASLIVKKILNEDASLGLIPTMDLLNNNNLFVSSKIGISFDAILSNSYIHFKEKQETIEELFLKGDLTTNEVILSKILFKEFYDVDIKTTLLSDESVDFRDNVLITGDENYEKGLFVNGLSFSEEIIELISAPYVNFVLAGSSDEVIKNFTNENLESLKKSHPDNFNTSFPTFPQSSLDFLSVNIQHLIFDFDEQDMEGIKQLLHLPFYHGLIKDIIDVKYV